MGTLNIRIKKFNRNEMEQIGHVIFRDRELIVEEDTSGTDVVLRYKIGDGTTPYSSLKYISSMYALFPVIKLYDKDYHNCLVLTFSDKE